MKAFDLLTFQCYMKPVLVVKAINFYIFSVNLVCESLIQDVEYRIWETWKLKYINVNIKFGCDAFPNGKYLPTFPESVGKHLPLDTQ